MSELENQEPIKTGDAGAGDSPSEVSAAEVTADASAEAPAETVAEAVAETIDNPPVEAVEAEGADSEIEPEPSESLSESEGASSADLAEAVGARDPAPVEPESGIEPLAAASEPTEAGAESAEAAEGSEEVVAESTDTAAESEEAVAEAAEPSEQVEEVGAAEAIAEAPAVEETVEQPAAEPEVAEVTLAADSTPAEAKAVPAEDEAAEQPADDAGAAITGEAIEVNGAAAAAVTETDDATEAAEETDAAPELPKPAGIPGIDWYIIHTYSGFENKVKESLRIRADAFGFADRIGEILIPTEDVIEMRSGKKVTSKRLLYPGYVLLQLKMDDELWHVVKNTPRVTGFVGGDPSPTPLTADEVNQILYRQTSSKEKPRPKLSFEHNDRVKIIDGPFTNFTGTVEEINPDRSTLKVMVTIFGRGTPVELEYFQVEKERL